MKHVKLLAIATCAILLPCFCTAQSQNFGSVAVGGSSAQTVTVTIGSPGTVASYSVRMLGAEGQDYTDAGGGTCAVGAVYAAGATCTVNVSFSPRGTGSRQGAVVLFDGSGGIMANTSISGIGMGAQIAFWPESDSSDPSTAIVTRIGQDQGHHVYPTAVAVDGAANLFVAYEEDGGGLSGLLEMPAGGGAPIHIDPIVDGIHLNYGSEIAIDGAGTMFIADTYNNRVVKVPPGGGKATALSPVVGGLALHYPVGVAVDDSGNLFISELNGRVIGVPGGGTEAALVYSAPSGTVLGVSGLAVDSAGDLFIADMYYGYTEIPVGGGAPIQINPFLWPNWGWTSHVLVNVAGDVFLTSQRDSFVMEFAGDGSAPHFSSFGPFGAVDEDMALDAAGNLYFADTNEMEILENPVSTSPKLVFLSAKEGSTSDDSPKSVWVENFGNKPLTFTSITYPADFPEGGGSASPCTDSTVLQPAEACEIRINFTPLSKDSFKEAVVLTNDSLSSGGAVQSIPVSGNGFKTQTITFGSLPNLVLGSRPTTLTATASSGLPVSYTVQGPASVSSNMLTPTGIGQVTVTASQAGNDVYAAAQPVTQLFLVQAASTTSLRVVWPQVTLGAPASFRVLVQGIGGLPTGAVTLYAVGNSLGQATLAAGAATFSASSLPAGSHSITAVYGGDTAHAGSTSSAVTEDIVTTPTMQLTALPNPLAAEGSTTVTATIEHVAGSPVPTGKGKFYLNRIGLGTVVVSNGTANWTIRTLDPGDYLVAAQFTGTGGFQTIQAVQTIVHVAKVQTSVSLTLSNDTPSPGTPFTVTATVAETLAGKVPGGTVNFYVDGQRFGPVVVVNGTASYGVSGLSQGRHILAVQYNGDQNYFVPSVGQSQSWVQLGVH